LNLLYIFGSLLKEEPFVPQPAGFFMEKKANERVFGLPELRIRERWQVYLALGLTFLGFLAGANEAGAMKALPPDGGFRSADSGENPLEQVASSEEKEEVKEFFRLAGQAYSVRFSTDSKLISSVDAEELLRTGVENGDYILHETKADGATAYWLETTDDFKGDNGFAISVGKSEEFMRVDGELVKPRYGVVSDLPEFVYGAHCEMNRVTGKWVVLDYGGMKRATADRTRNRGLAFEPNVDVHRAIEFYLNGLHFEGPGAEEIGKDFKDEILNMEELPTVDQIMEAYRNQRSKNPKYYSLKGFEVNMDSFNLGDYFPKKHEPSLREFMDALSKVGVVRIVPGLRYAGEGSAEAFKPGVSFIREGLGHDATIETVWKEMFVSGRPEVFWKDSNSLPVEEYSHAQLFAFIYATRKEINQYLAFVILTKGFPILSTGFNN